MHETQKQFLAGDPLCKAVNLSTREADAQRENP